MTHGGRTLLENVRIFYCPHTCIEPPAPLSEQAKVAQHEVALCTNEYFSIAVFEFFKQFTLSAERCFFGIT